MLLLALIIGGRQIFHKHNKGRIEKMVENHCSIVSNMTSKSDHSTSLLLVNIKMF